MRPDRALSVLAHIKKLISHNLFFPVSVKSPSFLDFYQENALIVIFSSMSKITHE